VLSFIGWTFSDLSRCVRADTANEAREHEPEKVCRATMSTHGRELGSEPAAKHNTSTLDKSGRKRAAVVLYEAITLPARQYADANNITIIEAVGQLGLEARTPARAQAMTDMALKIRRGPLQPPAPWLNALDHWLVGNLRTAGSGKREAGSVRGSVRGSVLMVRMI
jgi:hypothetical protein